MAMITSTLKHTPVLLQTVLGLLDPREGEVVLDVTVGLGGHARGFLERIGPKGKLLGIDADQENLKEAATVLRVGEVRNVRLIHANFRDLCNLPNLQTPSCDILFADVGVSSPHIDDPSRGFRYRGEAVLDCRYDRSQGITAAELLKRASLRELQQIFREYGELPRSSPLAQIVYSTRTKTPIESSQDLLALAQKIYGWRTTHYLPQIFQAIRIAVNDELGALSLLLQNGPAFLKLGGRMGVISYHSLEDRLVKQRFRELTTPLRDPLTGAILSPLPYELLTKRPLRPTLGEIESNPRARSARFRAIRKVRSV
jgi:16S rRNA (cytosine1402-N4)-methyltransferase